MFLKNKFFYTTVINIQLLLSAFVCAQDTPINNQTAHGSLLTSRVIEEKFLLINGIEQWITIKGDRSKPVILFLHGGPGSTLSLFADNIYKEWERDFILVQWDQRGAGKTYGRNAPEELTLEYLQSHPLTIEQMADDGIKLSEYLLHYLGKRKIILYGTSWGSALGVTMSTKRPDLFYAYVGDSQIVDPSNDEEHYNKVYQMALNNKDTASLAKLNEIGKPPYDRAKTVGQLWKIVREYESANSMPPPASWFVVAPGYDNPKDEQHRRDGDDYSFVNYVGDKQLGVSSIRSSINFLKNNLEFKIPVYFIQGEKDMSTPMESTKLYFDKLKAPEKNYVLLPNTAHGFNQSVIDAQYKIFKNIKAF